MLAIHRSAFLILAAPLALLLGCSGSVSDAGSASAGGASGSAAGSMSHGGEAADSAGSSGAGSAGSSGLAGNAGSLGLAGNAGSLGLAGNAGSSGLAGSGGTSGSAGSGGQTQDPQCLKPVGVDVAAQDYTLPAACAPNLPYGSAIAVTVTDEATFRQVLSCPAGTSSGIDFSTHRLRVTPTWPGLLARKWAVDYSNKCSGCPASAGVVHLGFDQPPFCGGAVPQQDVATLTLLPAAGDSIVEDLCTPACKTFYP